MQPVIPPSDFIKSDLSSQRSSASVNFYQYCIHLAPGKDCSCCFSSSASRHPLAFQHAISQLGISTRHITFVDGALVGDVFPLRTLSSLHFLQDLTYVLVMQLLPPDGGTVATVCRVSSEVSQSQAACTSFDLLAVSLVLWTWSPWECIRVGVLAPLTMLGCEVFSLGDT